LQGYDLTLLSDHLLHLLHADIVITHRKKKDFIASKYELFPRKNPEYSADLLQFIIMVMPPYSFLLIALLSARNRELQDPLKEMVKKIFL